MISRASLITNIIILAAGLLLCLECNRAGISADIVFITGVTLIIPGLINIVLLFSHRDDKEHKPTPTMKIAGWVSSVASVALGAIMVITPGLFTPVLVYLFGSVLISSALLLIYLLSRAVRHDKIAAWIFAGPTAVLLAGVLMVCLGQTVFTDFLIALISGISMIVFATSWFTASIMIAHSRRLRRNAAADAASSPSNTAE